MSTPAGATDSAWATAGLSSWQRPGLSIPEKFILAEFSFQLALLVPQLNVGALRVLWRTGAFAASLGLLVLLRGKTRPNATTIAALWVMALTALEIFHPTSNTFLSASAEAVMYIAILAPLFWMTRLRLDVRIFRRVVFMFWGYFTLSSMVGILQVYFPGRFQPQLSPVVASLGEAIEGLKIVLANGRKIFRPMGLTDMPGGAANAGMWAVLFGLGFLLAATPGRNRRWKQAAYVSSMMAGMMCIYLSQVRVLLVITMVWFVALMAILFWRQRWRQLGKMTLLVLLVVGGGLYASLRVGGANFSQRLATLGGSSKTTSVYTRSRGYFLYQTLYELIPDYPLGAGMGRWGMMNTYFGDNTDPSRKLVYVEIQWQGWVLDGGVPLVIAYLALLWLAMVSLWRIARKRGPLWLWAALCLAYDVGTIASCFDFTPFTGEIGLEFWFINALVLSAAYCIERQATAMPQVGWR